MNIPGQQIIVLTPEQLQDHIKQAIKDVMAPIIDQHNKSFLTHKEVEKLTGHRSQKITTLVETGVLKRGGGRGNYRYVAKNVYDYLSGNGAIKQIPKITVMSARRPKSNERIL